MTVPPKPIVTGYVWVKRSVKLLKVGNLVYTDSDSVFVHFGKICHINAGSANGIWSNNIDDLLKADFIDYDKYPRATTDKAGRGSFLISDTSYDWWVLEKEEDKPPFDIDIIEV